MRGNVLKSMFFQKSGTNILVFRKKVVPLHPLRKNNIAEWSSW